MFADKWLAGENLVSSNNDGVRVCVCGGGGLCTPGLTPASSVVRKNALQDDKLLLHQAGMVILIQL